MIKSSSFVASHSKAFLHVAHDNRIHLWDTDSRKEKRSYVEKNHLAHNYVCFSWKQPSKDNLGLFAVGCSDGVVIVWDLVRGIALATLGVSNESPTPTDLAFSSDLKRLFVSSAHNYVIEYRLLDGEQINSYKAGKRGILKIALNPKVDVLAVASTSVKLLDTTSGRKRKLLSNFSGGVSGLIFSPCGRYLASCGVGAREVLLFDVQASAKSSEPLCVVPVEGIPMSLAAKTEDNAFDVMCIFENKDACVIRSILDEEDSEGLSHVVTTTKLVTSCPVLAGCFGVPGDIREGSGLVTLTLGSASNPYFIKSRVENKDGELLDSVEVKLPGGVLGSGQESDGSSGAKKAADSTALPLPPVMLGPNEMGGVKRPVLESSLDGAGGVGATIASKKMKGSDGAPTSADSDWGELPDGVAEVELTLEQRLESLSASMYEVEERVRSGAKVGGGGGLPEEEVINADSLVTLVEQSLQSGDDSLLEHCLACEDQDTIDATARKLPVSRVVAFLRRLMAKFEKRPSRGVLITHWLSAVLRHHTSFLISVPNLATQLAGLSQMLEQRQASYHRMLSLAGRLDLLMHQVSSGSGGKGGGSGAVSTAAAVPRAVYHED